MAAEYVQIIDVLDDFEIKQTGEAQAGKEFHQKITNREPRAAHPTASAQPPIADERQIVIPANRLQTMPAARTRPQHALFVRQPMNTDVYEPAPRCSEKKDRDKNKAKPDSNPRFQGHRIKRHRIIPGS